MRAIVRTASFSEARFCTCPLLPIASGRESSSWRCSTALSWDENRLARGCRAAPCVVCSVVTNFVPESRCAVHGRYSGFASREALRRCGLSRTLEAACSHLWGNSSASRRSEIDDRNRFIIKSSFHPSLLPKQARPARPGLLRNLTLLWLIQLDALQNVGTRVLGLSLPVFEVLCGLSPLLRCQSLCANRQSPLLQSLQLFGDLLLLVGQLVGLAGLGPEFGYGEARVQVGAEVVHDTNWEHDVHAELEKTSVSWVA
jgi:hypothetical protein